MSPKIDFTEIELDQGFPFEQFVENLLRTLGWTIIKGAGKGVDGGRDIIASRSERTATGKTRVRKYVIQCKHYAHSGKSVNKNDISDCAYMPKKHDCSGWLLVTSSQLTTDAVEHIEAAKGMQPGADFDYWHCGHLGERLVREECHAVFRQYLPSSYGRFSHILGPSAEEIRSELAAWLSVGHDRMEQFSIDEDTDDSLTSFCLKYGQKLRDLEVLLAEGSLHDEFMHLWQTRLRRPGVKARGVVLLNGLRRLHQLTCKGIPETARQSLVSSEILVMSEYRTMQRRSWDEFIVFRGNAQAWTTIRANPGNSYMSPSSSEVVLTPYCSELGQAASGCFRVGGSNRVQHFAVGYSIENHLRLPVKLTALVEVEIMTDYGSDPLIVAGTGFSEFPGEWNLLA